MVMMRIIAPHIHELNIRVCAIPPVHLNPISTIPIKFVVENPHTPGTAGECNAMHILIISWGSEGTTTIVVNVVMINYDIPKQGICCSSCCPHLCRPSPQIPCDLIVAKDKIVEIIIRESRLEKKAAII